MSEGEVMDERKQFRRLVERTLFRKQTLAKRLRELLAHVEHDIPIFRAEVLDLAELADDAAVEGMDPRHPALVWEKRGPDPLSKKRDGDT